MKNKNKGTKEPALIVETDEAHYTAEERREIQNKVIEGREAIDTLTLGQLSWAFKNIDGMAAIAKGRILLAARKIFQKNDRAFGLWIKENGLDEYSQQTRNKYMHLAEHFAYRETTRMSATVCTEIALVMKDDRKVGTAAYEYALGRNLSKSDILIKIAELQKDTEKLRLLHKRYRAKQAEPREVRDISETATIQPEDVILEMLNRFSFQERIAILDRCRSRLENDYITNN